MLAVDYPFSYEAGLNLPLANPQWLKGWQVVPALAYSPNTEGDGNNLVGIVIGDVVLFAIVLLS